MAKMKPVKRHGLALSRSFVTAVFLSFCRLPSEKGARANTRKHQTHAKTWGKNTVMCATRDLSSQSWKPPLWHFLLSYERHDNTEQHDQKTSRHHPTATRKDFPSPVFQILSPLLRHRVRSNQMISSLPPGRRWSQRNDKKMRGG